MTGKCFKVQTSVTPVSVNCGINLSFKWGKESTFIPDSSFRLLGFPKQRRREEKMPWVLRPPSRPRLPCFLLSVFWKVLRSVEALFSIQRGAGWMYRGWGITVGHTSYLLDSYWRVAIALSGCTRVAVDLFAQSLSLCVWKFTAVTFSVKAVGVSWKLCLILRISFDLGNRTRQTP